MQIMFLVNREYKNPTKLPTISVTTVNRISNNSVCSDIKMQLNKLFIAAVLGFATTALAQEGKCTAKGECQENTSGVRLFCSSGSCDGKEGQSCTRNGPGSSNVANCPK
ncbi:uncharacterized protein BDZ83DRAFT_760747 [Colletotrichum acutatum]|uniref:Uncharacterized protein n=1 Tax=Glomerella acutata TaxID=27357 RepID=A0AAD8XC35_GLOAC|nr:uncharacterized protein BDZ83DRAFT_760747 [Colletotrichum acutatum]KAK1717364.1 hypothetical protein BDZ83DRAFT_760747 [Colletotrichum acutatum]